jgi:excisionase family DNA binding protein
MSAEIRSDAASCDHAVIIECHCQLMNYAQTTHATIITDFRRADNSHNTGNSHGANGTHDVVGSAPSSSLASTPPPAIPRLMLDILEVATALGCGRSLAYHLVLSGEIRSVKIGRLRRVAAEDLHDYVQRLRGVA